jgi:hypothetical protein
MKNNIFRGGVYRIGLEKEVREGVFTNTPGYLANISLADEGNKGGFFYA